MSTSKWIVLGMVLLLAISVILVVWPKARKGALFFILNAGIGLAGLWLVGFLGESVNIGINPITGCVCGLLGLPGVAMLVALKGFVL